VAEINTFLLSLVKSVPGDTFFGTPKNIWTRILRYDFCTCRNSPTRPGTAIFLSIIKILTI